MRDYYIGIDLGTTNSAIAWGHIDSNQIKTEIIQIDRQIDEIGRTREDVLLPSCIYFQGPDNSIVGDYAKTMVQEQPECVAKSMKCYMGDGYEVFSGANGVHWTPVKIAAEILKYLKCRAEEFFQFAEGGCPKEDKLVITVPASFNSTMRQATLDAAKLAGFEKITDANLLSEPRAALHHFCNKDLPDRIDFSKPKKILVFDLGGGTLDVSLHCVHREAELIIDDIAVSDYTPFGGDNFDELVAKTLLGKYIKAFKPFPALSPVELELLEFQFQEYAEEAKKKIG